MNEVGSITAYIIRESNGQDGYYRSQSGALVPVMFDGTLMDNPKIIKIGDEFFVCVGTNPLTYYKASFAEAQEIVDGKVI